MLIVYINKNKEKLKLYKYDTEPNFINKFINLIKELCLNEIEVAYLTLLLDKFDWKFDGINNHWIYLYILGIYTKQIVTSEEESVYFLQLKPEINEALTKEINPIIWSAIIVAISVFLNIVSFLIYFLCKRRKEKLKYKIQ